MSIKRGVQIRNRRGTRGTCNESERFQRINLCRLCHHNGQLKTVRDRRSQVGQPLCFRVSTKEKTSRESISRGESRNVRFDNDVRFPFIPRNVGRLSLPVATSALFHVEGGARGYRGRPTRGGEGCASCFLRLSSKKTNRFPMGSREPFPTFSYLPSTLSLSLLSISPRMA